MRSRAYSRAIRSAHAIDHGEDILAFVTSKGAVAALRTTADKGIPAVSAVSSALYERYRDYTKLAPVKTFIGQCVRAALEQEGYQVLERNVRLRNDKIFNRGTVYALTGSPPGRGYRESNKLLGVQVEIQLTRSQAEDLLTQLQHDLQTSTARRR